jgi:ABC-type branched-subunit amino acid transport system ATPase component
MLDEPSLGLAPLIVVEILRAIAELRRHQDALAAQVRQHLVGLGQDLGFGFRALGT